MKLYLIRHGQSCANRDDLFSTPTVELTENGRKDAERAGRLIAHIPFDRVLVSPYLRARETQRIAMPDADAEVVDALHEFNCGVLEGHSIPEMFDRYPSLSEDRPVDNYARYGGEDYADVRQRVRDVMDYVTSLGVERVAAFTHVGFILTFFDEVMGREGKIGRRMMCKNGSVNVFEYRNGKWWAAAMNITEDY